MYSTTAPQNSSQHGHGGKSSVGRTLARAGVSPQEFACTLATDKVSAVKSTMTLMLACFLPALSFNSPHPGHEKTHCCASSQPQRHNDHIFDPGRDTSPTMQHHAGTLQWGCPSPAHTTNLGVARAGCPPAASPAISLSATPGAPQHPAGTQGQAARHEPPLPCQASCYETQTDKKGS